MPVGANIAVNFSMPMKAQTITNPIDPAVFTLKQGTTPVAGTVVYAGVTAVFNPSSNLAANTLYTATLTNGATELEGLALASDYTWSFTTNQNSSADPVPDVISTFPAINAKHVPVTANISVDFNKVMNAHTITAANFTLKQGSRPVAGGTVTYAGVRATFSPPSNLAANTIYTATITNEARDLSDNALASEYSWNFTTHENPNGDDFIPTIISTFPANDANGVPIAATIAANFNEAMDGQTITPAIFTLLKQGTTPVAGTVSYDGVTAGFSPASPLANNTIYTVIVTREVRDLTGNALASNHTWRFATLPKAGQVPTTLGQAPVYLASAARFAVLAGTTVTNVPNSGTTIYGDLGVSPNMSVQGFPPGIVNGMIHAGGPVSDRNVATRAQYDLATAYDDAAKRSSAPIGVSGNIGGMTLYPGLYRSTSSLEISSGNLFLDARGDPNAVWIFQIASTLAVAPGRQIILVGGAKAANIFWQSGSSVTLGQTSVFKGTIMAYGSITMNTGATLDGRALARNGAVTLDGNLVTAMLPLVQNLSRLGYAIDTLEPGKPVFGDRDYVFVDPIPSILNGQVYIRTLNNEKAVENSDFLAFDVIMPVMVFVALDERIIPLPEWLAAWKFVGELRTTDDFRATRGLYSRRFPTGRVNLGPNMAAVDLSAEVSMYSIMIVPSQTTTDAKNWRMYY